MQPPNKGRRIQIRVNGRQRTGYYAHVSEGEGTVGWFYLERWFEFPAKTVEKARDAMRNYFSTLDALHEGTSPENEPSNNPPVPKRTRHQATRPTREDGIP